MTTLKAQIHIGPAECYDPAMTQGEVDDMADGTTGNPFATWNAALAFAQANNETIINFFAGTYTTDNSVFNAFSLANGGHPITLDGMTVNGNGSTIVNASGAPTAGFANIQADNVTLNDINLLEFGQAVTIEDVAAFNYNVGIIDGSDNGGLNGVFINSDGSNTDATFTQVDFNNHDTPNFTSAMDIFSSSTNAAINTTVIFDDCDWNCNVRDGFGGALFIGHGGSRSPAAAGPIVTMLDGGFYGNQGLGIASDGGGLNVQDNATLTIDGTEFVCNTSAVMDGTAGGGAIRIQGGAAVTIANANFSGNSTMQYGGAILYTVANGTDPALTITSTQFWNNTASRGGAIYSGSETTTNVTDSYIEGNNATSTNSTFNGGGGIYIDAGPNATGNPDQTEFNITTTTITGNMGGNNNGGGVHIQEAETSSDDPSGSGQEDIITITNSVICGNTNSDGNAQEDLTEDAYEPFLSTGFSSITLDANSVIGEGMSDNGVTNAADRDLSQGDCAAIPIGVGSSIAAPAAIVCPACPDAPTTPDDCSFVPVELLEFLVNVDDCTAKLHWVTATELDNSHFNVQRSFDTKTFETIAKVAGAGTTVEMQRYSFTDEVGKSAYYRLEQVDFSGATSLSAAVFADFAKCNTETIVELAPNPTQGDVFVSFNSNTNAVRLNLYDMYGRILQQQVLQTNSGSNTVQLSTTALAKGIYFVSIDTTEGKTNMVRFVKQ